jgi:hypothetical protein
MRTERQAADNIVEEHTIVELELINGSQCKYGTMSGDLCMPALAGHESWSTTV